MASLNQDVANDSDPPPQSSFMGRLNMENFRFKAEPQSPPAGLTPPRRSTRLSTTPRRTESPTRATPVSANSIRKRKAAVLAGEDTGVPALPDGSTEAEADAANPFSPSPTPTPGSSTKQPPPPKTKRRKRQNAGYQPPSVYAHLPPLPDALAPNLLALFCGLNPGVRTAQTGHAYNHPSNLFWKLMHSSGVLPVRCAATEDRTLPARFRLGLTNIVSRPSRSGAELSRAEMDAGVGALEAKVRRWRPEVVCVVGKSIWESLWRVRHGKGIAKEEFKYGWQDEGENMGVGDVGEAERLEGVEYREGWKGARVFVSSSTSGLAATLSPAEKERIWRELGQWVEARRAGRDVAPGLVDDVS
ncbi:uracil DNA N-glycosylase Thp1 [Diaporthe australafricana]|uniref:Uracil DNA N-glycosylase Thp1 n=1 Tax=Diaporthe australafricana TaxID=127596 RepID=A0ABR3WAT1_9PEZI